MTSFFQLQADRVDAIAFATGRLALWVSKGAIVENMAEMRAAIFTDDFGAMHAQ